jgi:hypothetical protein
VIFGESQYFNRIHLPVPPCLHYGAAMQKNTVINTTLTPEQLTALKHKAIEEGFQGVRSYVTSLLLAELNGAPATGSWVVEIIPPEEHPGDEWHCTYCFRWKPAAERVGNLCLAHA